MFAEILEEVAVERTSVLGVGMGIPGPVDRAHGTAGSATILPGWIGLSIAAEMEQRLGIPVRIENDANLGALAELTWGAGRDCSNFAYIKAATGIGAGIVIDGRLLRGATGTAGEIGHTTLDEAGPLCYCGNRGCLETVASGPAIVQLVGRVNGESLALSQIIELASEGDLRWRRCWGSALPAHRLGTCSPMRFASERPRSKSRAPACTPISRPLRKQSSDWSRSPQLSPCWSSD